MPMFGYRRPDEIGAGYSPNAAPMVASSAPVSQPAVAQPAIGMTKGGKPRGLFGKVVHSLNFFDEDPTFGDWLIGGTSRLDELRDRRVKAAQREQTQAALNQYIQNLPPELQPLARLMPDEVGKVALKQYEPDEYGYSDGVMYNKRRPEATRVADKPIDPIALARLQLDNDKFKFDQQQAGQMTPHQRAQFDLATKKFNAGLDDNGAPRPLKGPDAHLLTKARDAADTAQSMTALLDMFDEANRKASSGPGAGLQVWSPEIGQMKSAETQMRSFMRPAGSGATSDYEQRLYAQGPPSVDKPGAVNAALSANFRKLAAIQNARRDFYETFSQRYGHLNGAEQQFRASPEFTKLTAQAGNSAAPANAPPARPDPLGIRK